MEWTEDGEPGTPVKGDDLDRAIAREFRDPADNPTVTLELEYQTEQAWDFAFVQVYDEATGTWTSLANENTTDVADPDADPRVVANLPGFTGNSGGVTSQTLDLRLRG